MTQSNKILIVEDDKDFLEALSIIFEEDFKIYLAHDGQEAWNLFYNVQPQVVVTDIVMPRMDGAILTRKIKIASPDTNIFAFSGADKIHLKNAKEAGADDVFEKPRDMMSMYRAVNKLQLTE